MNTKTTQHLVALTLAGLVLAVSLATLSRMLPTPTTMLADGIGEELQNASPENVALQLARLEALNENALPALVKALTSERQAVTQGAGKLIQREIDRWQQLPPQQGARHVEHLAELLVSHSSGYHANSNEIVRDLVLRILQWPMDREQVDRTLLIANCEIVLRAVGRVVPATLTASAAATDSRNVQREAREKAGSSSGHLAEGQDLSRNAGEPRSNADRSSPTPPAPEPLLLPVIQPEIATLQPSVAEDRRPFVTRPSASSPTIGDRPLPPAEAPVPRDVRVPLATSRNTPIKTGRSATREPIAPFSLESNVLRSRPMKVPTSDELRDEETVDVMRWLLVEAAVDVANAELARRGFSEVQRRVARQIVDPDPQVRLTLAQSLPNVAGLDPRAWLLWLSRDDDANVRRATIAILATSPDPAVKDRLRELEREETDPGVLRLVQQALSDRSLR